MIKLIEFITNENGCHICTSHCTNNKGYPVTHRKGRMNLISRYLWEQEYGPISKGFCVLHKCDTPLCINLNHFFLGTRSDNNKDMAFKNRYAIGIKHPSHKLTENQVIQIRKDSDSQRIIAKKYGISQSQVGSIKTRRYWKELN